MFIYQGSIITNFLSQNGQQYKIPVYQRNYEWSKEQCKKLFEDIVQAAKRNQLHFTGSIVFQPLAPIKGINRHGRIFCVSDFRQNQECHTNNVHDWGLFPLSTSFPGGWDGMRDGTA